MEWVFPLLLGLVHGVSDGSAGLLIGAVYRLDDPATATFYLLLYNGLAFACQPAAGLLIDRFSRPRAWLAGGLLLTAGGVAVSTFSLPFGVFLTGLGSALMHASAGSLAILSTPGRASGPGLFAAFGVIGQALGITFGASLPAGISLWLALVPLGMTSVVLWKPVPVAAPAPIGESSKRGMVWTIALLLVAAAALRSLAWTGTQVLGLVPALWLALAAGTGKLLGGFVADRVGWRRWTWIALGAAVLLLAGGAKVHLLVLGGVFFLQSLTPLTLSFMGNILPGRPALAASLVLGAALVLGGLPHFLAMGWFNLGLVAPLVLILSLGAYWWAFGWSKSTNG
jgi:hypothetical protein